MKDFFENAEANTVDVLEYQEKELWQAVRKLFEDAGANRNDILNLVSAIEDEETSLEVILDDNIVYTEHHDSREEFRFQQVGNVASINQMDFPLKSLDQLGNSEYIEVRDNEGIRPEVRKVNDVTADHERKIDMMDCEASAGVEVKNIDTGALLDSKQTKKTQVREGFKKKKK